jgi:hypothetical protein
MGRSRFSEEQIIAILKEQKAGMATAQICRRHAVSAATFYKWKSKFGGRAVLWASAAVWRAIVRPGPMMRLCASGYASWRPSAAGSAIGVWGNCWHTRASGPITRSCCASTARKACGCAAEVASAPYRLRTSGSIATRFLYSRIGLN